MLTNEEAINNLESLLAEDHLAALSDRITDAHTRIQSDFENINPVVGVSRSMRGNGIPADAMTIDCLKSGKRIIIILHDQEPDIVRYQFSYRAQDPSDTFEVMPFENVTADQLYDWMSSYFSQKESTS